MRRKEHWPSEYGIWPIDAWNEEKFVALENSLAQEHGMAFWTRGPPGPELGGPQKWRGIPWNADVQGWVWTRASLHEHLPEYRWEDWNSETALKEEHAMAQLYSLPWSVRGPPGPDKGGPPKGFVWRNNLVYRPKADKWMTRGGQKTKSSSST